MARAARMLFPLVAGGLLLATALNAVTWLPVDVSGLTPAWLALFVGLFPTWGLVAILYIQADRRLGARFSRWSMERSRQAWRDLLVGIPRWAVPVGGITVAYVVINFFATIALLPGQPTAGAGTYYFDSHGRHIPTDRAGYLAGLRHQMRLFTGHEMVFFGVAALALYGCRNRDRLAAS